MLFARKTQYYARINDIFLMETLFYYNSPEPFIVRYVYPVTQGIPYQMTFYAVIISIFKRTKLIPHIFFYPPYVDVRISLMSDLQKNGPTIHLLSYNPRQTLYIWLQKYGAGRENGFVLYYAPVKISHNAFYIIWVLYSFYLLSVNTPFYF